MQLTPRRRRALAVVLTAAVAAVAPMGAASAQTKRHTDGAADMWSYDFSGSGDVPPVAAPEQSDGDITAWSVTHSTGSVTVRTAFVDLAKRGAGLGFEGELKTSEGPREFSLDAPPGHPKGVLFVRKPSGAQVRCSVSHSIDYAADTVVMNMARACFDKPTWVRAQLVSVVDVGDDAHVVADDGLSAGHDFTKFTGRAYRG